MKYYQNEKKKKIIIIYYLYYLSCLNSAISNSTIQRLQTLYSPIIIQASGCIDLAD